MKIDKLIKTKMQFGAQNLIVESIRLLMNPLQRKHSLFVSADFNFVEDVENHGMKIFLARKLPT